MDPNRRAQERKRAAAQAAEATKRADAKHWAIADGTGFVYHAEPMIHWF
jgi:hypothetical protein